MEHVAACRGSVPGRKYPSGDIGFEKEGKKCVCIVVRFQFLSFSLSHIFSTEGRKHEGEEIGNGPQACSREHFKAWEVWCSPQYSPCSLANQRNGKGRLRKIFKNMPFRKKNWENRVDVLWNCSFENHEWAPNTIFVQQRMQGMVVRPTAEKLTNNGIFPSALPGLQAIFLGGWGEEAELHPR